MHQLNKGFTIKQMSFSRMQADRESMYTMSFFKDYYKHKRNKHDAELQEDDARLRASCKTYFEYEQRRTAFPKTPEQLARLFFEEQRQSSEFAEQTTILKPGTLTKAARPRILDGGFTPRRDETKQELPEHGDDSD